MIGFFFLYRWAFVSLLAAVVWCVAPIAIAQPSDSAATISVAEPIDFNQATEAQLDGLRGVGPATTRRILQAREQRPFSDWADLIRRVRGIGHTTAGSFSAQGFVVHGAGYVSPGSAPNALTQGR